MLGVKSNGRRQVFRLGRLSALAILGLLWVAPSAALGASGSAKEPGVYKDGRKVAELEELLDPSSLDLLKSRGVLPSKAQRLRGRHVSAARAVDAVSQTSYYGAVIRLRDLVGRLGDGGWMSAENWAAIKVLSDELGAADRAIRIRFAVVGADLDRDPVLTAKRARHDDVVGRHAQGADELRRLLDDLVAAGAADDAVAVNLALQELSGYYDRHVFEPEPVFFSQAPLPVGVETHAPVVITRDGRAPVVASRTGRVDRREPTIDDLSETIDVKFTPAIVAKAAELGNQPAAIYEYVRNNTAFEVYLGSRKGSGQTLSHHAGGDYDLASLLIALLRTSGYPARYATGTVEMTVDQATNWLGVDSAGTAGTILTTAGMEGVVVNDPFGNPVAIQCRRVWVEAYLPFTNYRGAVTDSVGRHWVAMDPAFKQYTYDYGLNLPAEIGLNAEQFVNDYLSAFSPESVLENLKQLLTDSLNARHPGMVYGDLFTERTLIPETDGIIPGTLPYTLLTQDPSFAEIPGNKRYGIRFHVYGDVDLDYTTTIPEIVEQQVTISWIGATPADQQIIDSLGGVFNVTEPWLVDVIPQLRIDGCVVATGTGSAVMGTIQSSDMHFTAPFGAGHQIPIVQNVTLAGNYQGIGIDTEDAFPTEGGAPLTGCAEDRLGTELHQAALTYLNNVNVGGDELAGLLHQVLTNDVAEAIVENSISVLYNGVGDPISFTWTGLIVDADRKILGPVSTDGLSVACDFMRIGGAEGSLQENILFETVFEEEAISTIKILEIASDSGIPVCEITTSVAADCPGFSHSLQVLAAVNNALAIGHHVIIPQRSFTYQNWTGTGWIDIDPVTCAAGYLIGGGQSGGATVQDWNAELAALLNEGTMCTQPQGPILVIPLPDFGSHYYCPDNTQHWWFKPDLIIGWGAVDDDPCVVTTLITDHVFKVNRSIKSLAEDPHFGPGEYTFQIGSWWDPHLCGCTIIEETVAIVKVDLQVENLPDDKEVTEGALMLLNNDYDEGNENPAGTQVGDNANDHAAGDRIKDGDTDLLKGKLELDGDGITGKWKLEFPNKIKVWWKDGANWVKATSGTESAVVTLPEKIELRIEGVAVSAGLKDIGLKATFTPTGEPSHPCITDEVKLTVCTVKLEPITLRPNNGQTFPLTNPCGIEKGTTAKYEIEVKPDAVPNGDIVWEKLVGALSFVGGNTGRMVTVKGDNTGKGRLQVNIKNLRGKPPRIDLEVLAKSTVDVRVYIVRKDDGTGAAWTAATAQAFVDKVNLVYKQMAMVFTIKSTSFINKTAWLDISDAGNYAEMDTLCGQNKNTGGIEMYLVRDIISATGINYSPSSKEAGLLVAVDGNFRTAAHELGHAGGLNDMYKADHLGNAGPGGLVRSTWEPRDWNNGDGPLYYAPTLTQIDLMQRCIMYGVFSTKKSDFPRGRVWGYRIKYVGGVKTKILDNVKVGLQDEDRTPEHW